MKTFIMNKVNNIYFLQATVEVLDMDSFWIQF